MKLTFMEYLQLKDLRLIKSLKNLSLYTYS
jgi:hypothetical protein